MLGHAKKLYTKFHHQLMMQQSPFKGYLCKNAGKALTLMTLEMKDVFLVASNLN